MNSLAGHLLIAIPELPDSNFFRSVVLMLQHNEDGATGVILNRPSEIKVSTVWDEISEDEICDSTENLNIGGPVDGPLIAVHTSLAFGETPVLPGVYMSLSRENLNGIVTQDKHPFRLYTGYSGWGPGQLENEIDRGGWLLLKAEITHIFSDNESLWKEACAHVGHEIVMPPHLNRKSIPIDPSNN